ncbi:MAG: DUF1549 and DUF1553 domain-containing protein [Pirellulales bacterium]
MSARLSPIWWASLILILLASQAKAQDVSHDSSWDEPAIEESDRDHWAFRSLIRPSLPLGAVSQASTNPIDWFIESSLQSEHWTLEPQADRRTLLRRLTLATTGLPPTPEELHEFESDWAPDAYDRQVDRLLASPRFGEHLAQEWLDLARFAETDGFEHDRVREDAWRYRDWVIQSLNHDLSFDRFAWLQICGDLDPNPVPIATMFGLAGSDMPDLNDQEERRHSRLNDLTSTMGSVFLGLQMGCATCHDHKTDPISQADFYRLRALFESALPPLVRDRPQNLLSASTSSPGRIWIRGDHRQPGPRIEPGHPRIASSHRTVMTRREEFAAWLVHPDNHLFARVAVNRMWQHYFGRGLFDTPSDVGVAVAGPTHPELLDWLACQLRDQGWGVKQLHRQLLLSQTYRQRSRIDASEDSGSWKAKQLRDPTNRHWGRFPRQRMTGEMLRDSLVSLSQQIDWETGGPGVMPPLPKELESALLKGQWKTSPREQEHYRRSIYLFARRNLRLPLFEAFDRPDAITSCPIRFQSITAPQALSLMHSEFTRKIAEAIVLQWNRSDISTELRLSDLIERTWARPPTPSELQTMRTFLEDLRTMELATVSSTEQSSARLFPDSAWVQLVIAIVNSNEFLFVD